MLFIAVLGRREMTSELIDAIIEKKGFGSPVHA